MKGRKVEVSSRGLRGHDATGREKRGKARTHSVGSELFELRSIVARKGE